jgi:hypothetical protein
MAPGRKWRQELVDPTETVTLVLPAPPGPAQVRTYVVVSDGETSCEPLEGFSPDQPPEA